MELNSFAPLLLNVGEAKHDADWNWQNVCSPFARLYYIKSGKASITVNGEQIQLHPDKIYFIPPFVTHSTCCHHPFVHYYIHIYEESGEGSGIFEDYDYPIEMEAQIGDERLFHRLVELNNTMSLSGSDPQEYDNDHVLLQTIIQNKRREDWIRMESRGIIYQIFARFLRQGKPKLYTRDGRILQTIRYIKDHLLQDISTEQMAQEVGLSTEHFIRLFKQSVGLTPMLYVNRKRIERARLLLLTTAIPVKQIAKDLGFTNDSYFVRCFRHTVGVTPKEYRSNKQI